MTSSLRPLLVPLVLLVSSVALGSCAGMETAGGLTATDAGAGMPPRGSVCGGFPQGEACDEDSECEPNLRCILATPTADKMTCEPTTGVCQPGRDALSGCFRGARCEPAGSASQCTFVPASPVFFSADREVTVTGPEDRFSTRLQANQAIAGGFSFRWERPRLRADAVTVVAAFSQPPRRSAVGNRIANVEDIVWAWTSDVAAEGGAQTADISAGRAGFTRDGAISSARIQGLPRGNYFWMVFVLEGGVVTASSRPRTLSVLPTTGSLVTEGQCDTESDCVVSQGGVGESWACVAHQCVARCASNLDCASRGETCVLDTAYCGFRDIGRNGGHCGPASQLPARDAGAGAASEADAGEADAGAGGAERPDA